MANFIPYILITVLYEELDSWLALSGKSAVSVNMSRCSNSSFWKATALNSSIKNWINESKLWKTKWLSNLTIYFFPSMESWWPENSKFLFYFFLQFVEILESYRLEFFRQGHIDVLSILALHSKVIFLRVQEILFCSQMTEKDTVRLSVTFYFSLVEYVFYYWAPLLNLLCFPAFVSSLILHNVACLNKLRKSFWKNKG